MNGATTVTVLLNKKAKPTQSARRRVLTASFVVAPGTTAPSTRLSASGDSTFRTYAPPTLVSVLFVQPTSVSWLCKEIIKIFRLWRKCGFSVQCKCFCRPCAGSTQVLLANAQGRLFILFYIDFYRFDEKTDWWYIKKKGSARFRRSSPLFGYKAVLASKT